MLSALFTRPNVSAAASAAASAESPPPEASRQAARRAKRAAARKRNKWSADDWAAASSGRSVLASADDEEASGASRALDEPLGPTIRRPLAPVRERVLRQYARETRIEDRLRACVQRLLSHEELPANPYPFLARGMRTEEARALLFDPPRALPPATRYKLPPLDSGDGSATIVRASADRRVWGLERVVARVHLAHVQAVRAELGPTGLLDAYAADDAGVRVQAVSALCGSHLLHAPGAPTDGLEPFPRQLRVRETYLAAAEPARFDAALTAFITRVMQEAVRLDAMEEHVCLFVAAPARAGGSGGGGGGGDGGGADVGGVGAAGTDARPEWYDPPSARGSVGAGLRVAPAELKEQRHAFVTDARRAVLGRRALQLHFLLRAAEPEPAHARARDARRGGAHGLPPTFAFVRAVKLFEFAFQEEAAEAEDELGAGPLLGAAAEPPLPPPPPLLLRTPADGLGLRSHLEAPGLSLCEGVVESREHAAFLASLALPPAAADADALDDSLRGAYKWLGEQAARYAAHADVIAAAELGMWVALGPMGDELDRLARAEAEEEEEAAAAAAAGADGAWRPSRRAGAEASGSAHRRGGCRLLLECACLLASPAAALCALGQRAHSLRLLLAEQLGAAGAARASGADGAGARLGAALPVVRAMIARWAHDTRLVLERCPAVELGAMAAPMRVLIADVEAAAEDAQAEGGARAGRAARAAAARWPRGADGACVRALAALLALGRCCEAAASALAHAAVPCCAALRAALQDAHERLESAAEAAAAAEAEATSAAPPPVPPGRPAAGVGRRERSLFPRRPRGARGAGAQAEPGGGGGGAPGSATAAPALPFPALPRTEQHALSVTAAEADARARRAYPAPIARESALLQYCVDTEVDVAAEGILEEIYGAPSLPPHPPAVALGRLLAAAAHFPAARLSDHALLSACANEPVLADVGAGVYRTAPLVGGGGRAAEAAGADGLTRLWGARGAILFADARALAPVWRALDGGRASASARGAAGAPSWLGGAAGGTAPAASLAEAEPELSVHVCFSGPRALLTRLLPPRAAPPALSALELTVARGGSWARAVELFCRALLARAVDEHRAGRQLLLALWLGGRRWGVRALAAERAAALRDARAAVDAAEPIVAELAVSVPAEPPAARAGGAEPGALAAAGGGGGGGGGGAQRYVLVSRRAALHVAGWDDGGGAGGARAHASYGLSPPDAFESVWLGGRDEARTLAEACTALGDGPGAAAAAAAVGGGGARGDADGARARGVIDGMTRSARESVAHGERWAAACTWLCAEALRAGADRAELAALARLHLSPAAQLAHLAEQGLALTAVLRAVGADAEVRASVQRATLGQMLRAYRVGVLHALASDGCCFLEPAHMHARAALGAADLSVAARSDDALAALTSVQHYLDCIQHVASASALASLPRRLRKAMGLLEPHEAGARDGGSEP